MGGYSESMFLIFVLYHLMLSEMFMARKFGMGFSWGLNFGPGISGGFV